MGYRFMRLDIRHILTADPGMYICTKWHKNCKNLLFYAGRLLKKILRLKMLDLLPISVYKLSLTWTWNGTGTTICEVLNMADLKALSGAIIKGDQKTAVEITQAAIDEGMAPGTILEEGLIAGMNVIGVSFKANEVYIPEVLIAARAMKMAMEILEPKLIEAGVEPLGKALIGTVQGDLHDIGKNLVMMMLKGAGFDVVDAGVDVSAEDFVAKAKENNIQVVGLSALLTTTMPAMEKTIKAIKDAGVATKVMIGGAPVTQGYADKIGADGYAPDAASAVDLAKSLL
jgi:5-methyltetrahydrofolate--homocysteine methyltransferase